MTTLNEYVCLDFFVRWFAHGAMSPSVSVKTFQDADAVFARVNKSDIRPFFSVTEDDIKPGIVFITNNPLVDKIKWGIAPTIVEQNSISANGPHTGQRITLEKRSNGETLWMTVSEDERLTKYTTTRCLDGDKISLAAYLLSEKLDDFTPAKIKYASISSFIARVRSDAEDVARGLSMEMHSLLAVAFKSIAEPLSAALPTMELLSERTW